jgi:hypothetical protein
MPSMPFWLWWIEVSIPSALLTASFTSHTYLSFLDIAELIFHTIHVNLWFLSNGTFEYDWNNAPCGHLTE